MRFLTYITLSLLSTFLPSLLAAPALSTTQSASTTHIASHITPHPSSHHRPTATTAHSLQILSQISVLTQVRHTHITPPNPIHTHITAPNPIHTKQADPSPPPRRTSQKPIAIFFEVLGGVAGLALVIGISRCYYNYRRTPKRDRIAAVLSRHQLERELEELERNPITVRRSSMIRDPAPPYFPPPPSYEIQPTTRAGPSNRTDYVGVATASPPTSLSSFEQSLEESPASTSHVGPHRAPREPNG